MTAVFCFPGDLDTPTGGYRYDRRILRGSTRFEPLSLPGDYPFPDVAAIEAAARAIAAIPDASVVVVDGLALGALPQVLARERERLVLVGLVHHPLHLESGLDEASREWLEASERLALQAVRRVVVTSARTVADVVALGVASEMIEVIEPGTDLPARSAARLPGTMSGRPASEAVDEGSAAPLRLLCVASVIERKGHVELLAALASVDRDQGAGRWRLTCVGSLDRDPAHASRVLATAAQFGSCVEFVGELDDPALAARYADADLFVLASRHEGFGMVLTEAIAHGLPIIATRAGAIPLTVGENDADCPARLVPVGDVDRLALAIGELLRDRGSRDRLALAAQVRRLRLTSWSQVIDRFDALLERLAMPTDVPVDALDFDAGWLRLREAFDQAARQRARLAEMVGTLESPAIGATDSARALTGFDLGGGTGSLLRYLMPAIGGAQRWQLADRDPALLSSAARAFEDWSGGRKAAFTEEGAHFRICSSRWDARVEPRRLDLLDRRWHAELAAVSIVAASALLDLVSQQWFDELLAACAAGDAALVFSMNYDGRIEWSPSLPTDEPIRRAINEDQRTNKGFGPAMGPDCATQVPASLRRAGYACRIAVSDWMIEPGDTAMQRRLIDDFATIAMRVNDRSDARVVERWRRERHSLLAQGRSRLRVGHVEIVARQVRRQVGGR